jgi:GT2 family glycosyltransferase
VSLPQSNDTIGIVTVYYNQPQYVKPLIDSLMKQSYVDFILHFVDNGSSGDILKVLQSANIGNQLNIKYIRQDNNTGYAAGTNKGAKLAIKDGCQYLFILNTDVMLHKNCIQELVLLIQSGDNVACTGPIIMRHYEVSPDIVQEYGGEVNFRSGSVIKYYTNKNLKEILVPPVLETSFISGGACLIRSEIFERAGMLEESYFAYLDEIDLFYRIKMLGSYKMLVTSKAVLWHNHDWSTQNAKAYYIEYYLGERNKYLFFYKYKLWGSLISSLFIDMIKFPIKSLWFKKVCDYKLSGFYLKGLLHGLMRIKGKPYFIQD